MSKWANGIFRKKGKIRLNDVYRVYLGKRSGFDVWVVDSDRVQANIYPAFLMGGNDQRYRFNPVGEVWLDNQMSVEELETTLIHEIVEQQGMENHGWTYNRAHNSGYKIDQKLRKRNRVRAARHAAKLNDEGWKYDLTDIYRGYHGKVKGLKVWFVDGPRIRETLDYDFGFAGGHDKLYKFIPKNEIWIDCGTPLGQFKYALVQLLTERKLIGEGVSKSRAYEKAVIAREEERERQTELCRKHESALPQVRFGARHRGVKAKKK